jgi:alpha-acetolactate decarboxylase
MDGEMVLIDSNAYQLRGDGTTPEVTPSTKVPFAMVSRFAPELSKFIKVQNKAGLEEEIARSLPAAKNAFVLVKLQGQFKSMKIRAIHAQSFPGEPLTELTAHQMIKEFHDVKGTVVGLRSPRWSVGLSVVGLHVHFINMERTLGGHILEMTAEEDVLLSTAVCNKFHLQLPDSKEFGARELKVDEVGIKKAEG